MYDFQERNRTAFHLTGSELRCSIFPFRPSFYTFSDTSSDFVFVISITLWSFLSSCSSPDSTGCFDRLLTRIGKMSGKKPGASLTPRSPCFRPRTRLDISPRHYPSTPANSHLFHNVQTYHVYKPSHGKKAKDCTCFFLKN